MRCPECKSEDTTMIEIKLKEEDTVSFFQCRKCETKWWEHAGDTIALDEVLNLTADAESK